MEPIVKTGTITIIDNGEASEALVEQMEATDSISINSANDDLLDAAAYQTFMNLYYTENENSSPLYDDEPTMDLFSEDDEDDGDYGGSVFN